MNNICKLNFNDKTKMVSNNPNESKLLEIFFDVFKTTKVGIIKLGGKEYLLKKEYFIKNFPLLVNIYKFLKFDVHEYKFYRKYENIIKKSNYRKNIQLPIKYKICKDSSIYIFEKIDTNLNSFFLKTLMIPVFNKILHKALSIIYYINHTLHIFHNDLYQNNKPRNFMVNKLKSNYTVILIDFGLFSNVMGVKNQFFYKTKGIKYGYKFIIKSELLIVLYIFLINYYKNLNINFHDLYLYFYNKLKIYDLKEFDTVIYKSIKNIDEILRVL